MYFSFINLLYLSTVGLAVGATPRAKVLTVVSADGTEIYAEAIGDHSKPHIIFAHGVAATTLAFDSLFTDPKLYENLYMANVRFDTRGHGRSGKPTTLADYDTARYAQDVAALVKGFRLKKPFFAGCLIYFCSSAIGADIATNLPHPVPFSGLIWFDALPYLGDIINQIALPAIISLLPGFTTPAGLTNSTLAVDTRITYANGLSVRDSSVPFSVKAQWVGSAAYLPPALGALVLGRTQDPTALFAAGEAGWPLLILHGRQDLFVNGTLLIEEMAPHFRDVEAHLIGNAEHVCFYDKEEIVAGHLLGL
ncbi:Alpha/Beta hydrolase protein [Mycena sp. CBHHK59/15]|nr:Alpha/Beta hydrolase protein [Mycena sp. CBHHK59/15]